MKTVITITVYHDRMTREENKLFDQSVSEATLRIPGYGARSTLMEVLTQQQAEVKLEVIK